MFQFTPSPSCMLCIHIQVIRHLPWLGFPIRTSAGLRIFAPYRSLSQLIASFFGYRCQGIHPALLVTWPIYGSLSSISWHFDEVPIQRLASFSLPIVYSNLCKTFFEFFTSLCLFYLLVFFLLSLCSFQGALCPLVEHLPDLPLQVCLWWAQEDSNLRPYAYQAYALNHLSYEPVLVFRDRPWRLNSDLTLKLSRFYFSSDNRSCLMIDL